MNRGMSVKYRVHINMSETYSMRIFSSVPMFEKKKVLLGAKSHFWQVSKWPKSTKESFFFLINSHFTVIYFSIFK